MKREHKLIYSSCARNSLLNTYTYYELSQKDLGDYFISSLEECISIIDRNSEIFKLIYKDYRQAKIYKFPYVVIFRIKVDTIIIDNIFNTHQNPTKKFK